MLQQVRTVTLGAYENQAYPFDRLVDALDLSWDPSRNALFDVWAVLHNARVYDHMQPQELGELKVRMYEWTEHPITKFDVMFHFIETGASIQLMIEYNTDILERKEVEKMGQEMEEIIGFMIKNASSGIREIDELLQEEQLQTVRSRNLLKLKNY